MPSKDLLTPAAPGAALTAGAWNALAGGIEGLYAALGSPDRCRCFVEVRLTHRGALVRGARVIATPVDPPGPPLSAVAPIGDLSSYTIAGLREGSWQISIHAAGFANETRDVEIAAHDAPEPLSVPLTRTAVPAPELVNVGLNAATRLLGWAQLVSDTAPFSSAPLGDFSSRVLVQAPHGSLVAPGSTISTLHSLSDLSPPPSTVVPELLGFPANEIAADNANDFLLTITSASPAQDNDRVLFQSVRPGEILPGGSVLELRYGPGDIETVTFGAYSGTHAKLANAPVKPIRTALDGHRALTAFEITWCPWEIARTYVSDAYLAELLAFFADGFDVAPSTAPGEDLEALWRSFMVVVHAQYL